MKISFIIPTLNEEKTIGKTLQSLKELRNYDHEIIVSDGRSTDKTIEIAKDYGAKIVVYEGITRQTISNGRNLGASLATGDFLVFLDADVVIPNINKFFIKILNTFKKEGKLVGLTVSIRVLPELETLSDKIIFKIINYYFFVSNNLFRFGGASGEFQVIKTSVFKKLGGYNEKISVAEDIDMFKRLQKEGKTKIELSLEIMHTGRRAHKTGWPKLLLTWWINWISVTLFGRSFNNVWKEIR